MILIPNHTFLIALVAYRASLDEPWVVFWCDIESNTHNENKQA